ncbi:MAG: PDZ domain-containing protein [Odoribacteraceae bacterium]|jgi:carboxyl-terminal processing protease|nr:PDZ domain-containing protein [Odoribacteraceae bacterium]
MNNKTLKTALLPVAIALAVVIGIVIAPAVKQRQQTTGHLPFSGSKLDWILGMIAHSYVDSVDVARLEEEVAIPALLHDLDPHTVYIPAKDMQRTNESIMGNFGGIGIQFYKYRDTVVVIKVIPDGPSEAGDIRDGDRIVRVDDSIVAGKRLISDDIMGMMRGEIGTKVRLTIHRPGANAPLVKQITRGSIPLKSVEVAFMPNDTTGYVKISIFDMNALSEMTKAIDGLTEKGARKLIIDLRGNEGGVLAVALNMVNEFLPPDCLMLYTLGNASPRKEYRSNGRGRYKDIQLVVLIDELSASASEIFAGAIQDNDRGLIVGRRSYGKGLVQEQRLLPDGSALRLTVARYYIPSGRSIQRPYDEGKEKYYSDIYQRVLRGELSEKDSIIFDENLKFTTLGGRAVYGGGGIMPDIFVPVDTAGNTRYLSDVIRAYVLYDFSIDFMDRHRSRLAGTNDVDSVLAYLSSFHLVDDFVAYATTRGIRRNDADIRVSRALLDNRIKSYIARHVMDNAGFYPIFLRSDETFAKSLENISINSL